MPKWGLVPSPDSSVRPWGIQPKWLQADKANTDPIHDRVYLNVLERHIVDSAPYQRLRRLRQLGTTHLVYPGATHSRFAHSLGTLRVTQDILDELFENPVTARRRDSLLTQWEDSLPPSDVETRKLEVQVLARLGALLHDFCHVPFGHTIEDDYGLLLPHDKNSVRFDFFWGQLDSDVREAIGTELRAQLRHLALPKWSHEGKSKYPFVEDIVGNTICADLIDYLARDFYNTGLPAGLGVHFLTYFFVTRDDDKDMPQRLALRLTKADRTRGNRPDVVSEVMKYLRHRYELGERVLEHHTHVAADAMLGRAFEFLRDIVKEDNLEDILRTLSEDALLERIAADDAAAWL
jgi:HD superfamily phosphohydrolase